MKIGWFSTDWTFERVPDELASARSGKQEFVANKRTAAFGGTYYYRMALPAVELSKHGWDCVLSPAVRSGPDGRLLVFGTDQRWHDDCDVVMFQRWMHADGVDMARKAQACGQVVVNDVDDQFWALPVTNIAHKTTDPKNSPDFNRDHYRKMIGVSDAVICSTPSIAAELGRLGPSVSVCRNAIDIERWKQRESTDGLVGWVGGIPWRGNDLPLLRGIVGPFLEANGLSFYHGGHSPDHKDYASAAEQLGLADEQVVTAPIVPIALYPRLWEPVALAVIPLEDSAFNRSKSWLKGLEAAACGIPFVASRLPEYQELGCGRLAKTRGEWRAHLDALVDPEVRKTEGAANRVRAEELSIDKQWSQWDTALREAMTSRPSAPPARMALQRSAPRRRVRVAVGVATYNRPKFFTKTAKAVAQHLGPVVDRVYVHDDGSLAKHRGEYSRAFRRLPDAVVQADGVNRGVAAAKNALLSAMLDDGAEWLFLLEDDIRVLSPKAVCGYLDACELSGLHHLSFAHHGPLNAGGPGEVDGPVSMFEHSIGAWAVYSRESLEKCGLLDENFSNAWEHVEHSLRLAQHGYTTGAYRWADATGSENWLQEQPGSIDNSSIGAGPAQQIAIVEGLDYWRSEKRDTYDQLFGPGTPLEGWALERRGIAA